MQKVMEVGLCFSGFLDRSSIFLLGSKVVQRRDIPLRDVDIFNHFWISLPTGFTHDQSGKTSWPTQLQGGGPNEIWIRPAFLVRHCLHVLRLSCDAAGHLLPVQVGFGR